MENFRIKEVAKSKGFTLSEIANKLNISYVALNRRLISAKFDTLQQIAEILNCEVHELLNISEEYSHFYDSNSGEWLGIRKK